MTLREKWLRHLGGLATFSVKNKEWLSLLEEDTRQSLMIEGEFVDRRELKSIIERGKDSASAIALKVLGYFDAAGWTYGYAFEQYRENEFQVSKSLIRQIHSVMFRNDSTYGYSAGEWRRGDITIHGAPHTPPAASRVESAIEELVTLVNTSKLPPTKLAAFAHALFEHIHPFPDGNGRVGRILMNFILIGHGLPNIALKGTDGERSKYVLALEDADKIIGPALLQKTTWSSALKKPLLRLEDLIAHNLAIAMDLVICSRFEAAGNPLVSLDKIAWGSGRQLESLRSAFSQKKYIAIKRGKHLVTHSALLKPPQAAKASVH